MRADFGRVGRQISDILLGFCLLLPPRAPISVGSVDKFQTFCSVFVYFCLRAGRDAQWQPVSAYFYGQIAGNGRFVRKMRFDYGQISKNGLFVRKFE